MTDEKIREYIKNIEKIHVSNDDTLGYLKKSSNETGKVTGKVENKVQMQILHLYFLR